MSADSRSEPTCPDCGAELHVIDDCFTGEVKHIDNFSDVEDHLRDRGVVGTDDPLLARYSEEQRAEAREQVAASDHLSIEDVFDRDGPFITDSIVCTETSCTDRDCGYATVTYTPPGDVVASIADAITD